MVKINVDEDLLKQCVENWGVTAQLLVAVEECAEFIQAAMRFENRKGSIDNLMSETADALFLLLQMRLILGEANIDYLIDQTQNKVREKLK